MHVVTSVEVIVRVCTVRFPTTPDWASFSAPSAYRAMYHRSRRALSLVVCILLQEDLTRALA